MTRILEQTISDVFAVSGLSPLNERTAGSLWNSTLASRSSRVCGRNSRRSVSIMIKVAFTIAVTEMPSNLDDNVFCGPGLAEQNLVRIKCKISIVGILDLAPDKPLQAGLALAHLA